MSKVAKVIFFLIGLIISFSLGTVYRDYREYSKRKEARQKVEQALPAYVK